MTETRLMVPVTGDLLKELISTETLIAELDGPNARIKDTEHYRPAVLQLAALAKAILVARASVSLLTPNAPGARFCADANGHVLRIVDTVAAYLAKDAANLLRHDGGALSQYEKTHTLNVRNQLAELHGRITDQIRIAVGHDLNQIRKQSTELLVATADIVAKVQAGDADGIQEVADAVPGANGARCPAMLTGKGRCTKRAGHLARNPTDTCTAN